jgi:glucose/arabinose dehydrogenase
MTHAGDGTNRLWVVEKAGKIKLVVDGQVRTTPYLDLTDIVVDAGPQGQFTEQGLLGLAFHPQYETNGRFFVYFTANPTPGSVGNNTLAEYHVDDTNPEIANPMPVRTLLSIPDSASNHNGGTIAFGQDGKLYLATGDGGADAGTAQNPQSLFGKVLRIDVDVPGTPQPPGFGYSIPSDNPFVGNPAYRPEIWALGFRNPYRWSFDRLTGDMLMGDVGSATWEEVDLLPKGVGGLNMGWVIREGKHCTPPAGSCQTAGLTDPILEYDHSLGCSITGGYRYRGGAQAGLYGAYLFADYCTGRIWKGVFQGNPPAGQSNWTSVEALDTTHNITGWGEDRLGELYIVTSAGEIHHVVAAAPPPCAAGRPRIGVQSTRIGAGRLRVTVTPTTNATTTTNALQSIEFARIDNAFVTLGAQVDQQSPFTVPFPGGSPNTQFTVRRKTAGLPMTVHVTITDACGAWSTFVGGGANMP